MQSFDDERFSRLLAISSYPAAAVRDARVIVGGVGALGNELVKNLCLLGFRNLHLIDKDYVERSNLTRSVLFTEQDVGKSKVAVAAEAARRIYADVRISGQVGDVAEAGFGVFRRADLIFSDFDGFYPRLFINDAALKVKKPWIDAALGLDPHRGSVMVYDGSRLDRACFICRIGVETAVAELVASEGLIGCQLLDRRRIDAGFLPTAPTTAAAIAALQTQAGLELLRLGTSDENPWLHGGISLDLGRLTSTRLIQRRVERCPGHDARRGIDAGALLVSEEWRSETTTVGEAFRAVRSFMELERREKLYLQYHTLYKGIEHCRECGQAVFLFRPVYVVEARRKSGDPLPCPHCGSTDLESDDDFGELSAIEETDFPDLGMSLAEAGFRRLDIIKFFCEQAEREVVCHAEIAGDADEVFKPYLKE